MSTSPKPRTRWGFREEQPAAAFGVDETERGAILLEMTGDDTELVALIDNELDESSRNALVARLAGDERLRHRYDELRAAGAQIGPALDALLSQAPLARLRAALLPEGASVRRPPGRFAGIALRELAAGIAIGLLVAGAAAWLVLSSGLLGERGDWRSAVVEYTNLYTNETFEPLKPGAAQQAKELTAVRARVGGDLTPENVSLPGLRFATAFMLSHEGYPLGVIAFVDPSGTPILLCVLANRASDAPIRSERRGDLSLASWSDDGRSYLVIGRIPEERAVALAQILQPRV
jgi:anti-sigma factor RsiW